MKRWFVDCLGNYIFFVPLVCLFTPVLWSVEGVVTYMIAAVPISFVGPRLYTLFLKHIWYPRWGIKEF